MNWNDLSYLLAVMRGGSLLQAARLKGVDKTTVARRLAALEADLGQVLTERSRDGRMTLTDAGRRVAQRAETIEDAARAIKADHAGPESAGGCVRLTAVPLVVNHLLLPEVSQLTEQAPGVSLELIADARDLSLLDRDADIAVRLARPQQGGQSVVAWRVGALEYGCFAPCGVGAVTQLPWIGYEPRMAYLSHAQAIEELAAAEGKALALVRVNDAETLVQAVRAGLGKTLLPRRIGRRHRGLIEVSMPGVVLPTREIWLMVRRDIRHLARIEAVVGWVQRALAD